MAYYSGRKRNESDMCNSVDISQELYDKQKKRDNVTYCIIPLIRHFIDTTPVKEEDKVSQGL